ncbi:hypothetical protein SDC9_91683 [bioreactor metagenome]|uniref:Uncharacterized protein n=1 Tax=bioreactor metagenome TaxID=1076179 RepID=A0A644ZX54_9ZZZZ
MQGEVAGDVVERDISLKGVYALMCFVYNEKIPR